MRTGMGGHLAKTSQRFWVERRVVWITWWNLFVFEGTEGCIEKPWAMLT
jgi:hypothetical protein